MSCMKFFNQIKEKIVVESVTICMHLHTKTQMQTLIEVYAAIIFAIHNIIEKSQRTLTWVREMFPLSVYLSVNSGIPNAYHRICVTTFAMHKHTGRVPFVRTFLMKFMKYTHDTSWMHKETRLCFGRWLEKKQPENREKRCEWSVEWQFSIQPQQMINILCAKK